MEYNIVCHFLNEFVHSVGCRIQSTVLEAQSRVGSLDDVVKRQRRYSESWKPWRRESCILVGASGHSGLRPTG